MNRKRTTLTLFGFFAMTASMVMTADKYATFASSGFSLIFFLVSAGFLWFIPVSLCAAEMATVEEWKEGGILTWVSNTLGERLGFAAIFFQWFQITIGFISMTYFILGALADVLNFPQLNTQPMFKFIGVLIVFWLLSLSQLPGTRFTALIAKIGFIIGIVIPVSLLFVLSALYFIKGGTIHITMDLKTLIPDFSKLSTLVIFASFVLSFMGIEVSASHIKDLENPAKNYPLTMITLVVLAICLNTIGSLTVAAVVPVDQLNYSSGVVQTFTNLINFLNPNFIWVVRLLGLMIALGVMGEISSWVIGPSRGLYHAASKNLLPKIFTKTNKQNVPVPLILLQGIIVSIWAGVLTFGGGGNNLSFLTAISLTVILYLFSYFLFFMAYFILIFKHKNLTRSYEVPFGFVFKVILASIGFIVSIFTFFVTFIPPAQLSGDDTFRYQIILIVSFIITLLLPFMIYSLQKKYGSKKD